MESLYNEVLMDHNRHPKNHRTISEPTHTAHGVNPVCGDEVTLQLTVKEGVIEDIAFQGHGCAISIASASLMTERLRGKTLEEAMTVFEQFRKMIRHEEYEPKTLGKIRILESVRDYPSRVKCVTLPWYALKEATDDH